MSQLALIISIAIGGALGACGRYFVSHQVTSLLQVTFPWGTFVVNIIGSLCMGLLISAFAHYGNPSQEMRAFLVTGCLGAFTTFSTFSLDAVTLLEKQAYVEAFLYIGGSVIVCLASVIIGMWLVRAIA